LEERGLVAIKERFKQRLAGRSSELAARDLQERPYYLADLVKEFLKEERIILPDKTVRILTDQFMNEVIGLGPLESVLMDDTVTEIMINAYDQVYIERNGQVSMTDIAFDGIDHLYLTIDRIVAPLGLRVDESNPMVDARLPDGSRVNVIIPPVSLSGPVVTIRRFRNIMPTVDELINNGTLSRGAARFLMAAVKDKKNIIVSGGTGSGKTTLLNMLASFIAPQERLVTIEDTAELRLAQPHVVTLESRRPNIEGEGEVTIRDLVRNALRMRPDRIIVGEVRGGEALDMLQAMNTGHEGSITTAHANSARDLIKRLEVMVLTSDVDLPHGPVVEQIAAALDLVLQMERNADGTRRLTEISKIAGMKDGHLVVEEIGCPEVST
jgi:pilus assembly protein CpaF